MKYFIQISVLLVVAQWCGEVECKHIFKTLHVGFVPLPSKHFSFMLEKLTPFGTYEFKHTIKKRQIVQPTLPSPVSNEVQAVDDPSKLPAEVLITSVVDPLEPGKPISFLLPFDSEVVITPAVKDIAAPVTNAVEVPVSLQPEIVPEVVPLEIPPLPEVTVDQGQPVIESNVVLTTPIESTVPQVIPASVGQPVPPVGLAQNLNTPVISPVVNGIPIVPFLYPNIKGIPFYTSAANVIPFITPGAVSIPEAIVPPSLPPVINNIVPVVTQESPPVIKEDPPPNFFVKSSRFVLYFGSMMLQMLSRFVNGQANLNQITLPPQFPGIQ